MTPSPPPASRRWIPYTPAATAPGAPAACAASAGSGPASCEQSTGRKAAPRYTPLPLSGGVMFTSISVGGKGPVAALILGQFQGQPLDDRTVALAAKLGVKDAVGAGASRAEST